MGQLPYMTNVSAFFDEFIGTALLIIVILAATDKRNGPPPSGLLPLVLFITFCGITAAFGAQTGKFLTAQLPIATLTQLSPRLRDQSSS